MKKYNWTLALLLLTLAACQTNAKKMLIWKEDGTIEGVTGKKIQLEIQGIYDSLDYAGVSYLAGFKIDSEGNNFPHIVQIQNDLSSIQYWSFEHIPSDIFLYKNAVHITTTNGQVYSLENKKWNLIDVKFPREPQVVYSGQNSELVICHPASLEMTVNQESGCFSTANNWKLNFVWFSVVPKVCGNTLYIVEEGEVKKIKQIELATGKVLKSTIINKLPADICTLRP